MAYNTLENFYRTQFALRHHHGWSVEDMNNEIPWEREIQLFMLNQFLEEEKERLKEQGVKV